MKLLKYKIYILVIAFMLVLTLNVFAGSYTNTNQNANINYNRANSSTYAKTYAENPNGSYHYYTSVDCTNFVSQCLGDSSAGGLTQGYDLINGGYPLYSAWESWYYVSYSLPGGVSHTWSGAHNFRYHWANVNNSGINRSYKYQVYQDAQAVINDWTNVYSMLWKGDVIQLVRSSDGNTHHSMIIHDYKYNSTYGVNDFLYAQHSADKKDQSFYTLMKTWAMANKTDEMIVVYEIKKGG